MRKMLLECFFATKALMREAIRGSMKDEELDRDEDEAPPVFCLCFFCVLVTGSNFHSQVTAATGNETRSTAKGNEKRNPGPGRRNENAARARSAPFLDQQATLSCRG